MEDRVYATTATINNCQGPQVQAKTVILTKHEVEVEDAIVKIIEEPDEIAA